MYKLAMGALWTGSVCSFLGAVSYINATFQEQQPDYFTFQGAFTLHKEEMEKDVFNHCRVIYDILKTNPTTKPRAMEVFGSFLAKLKLFYQATNKYGVKQLGLAALEDITNFDCFIHNLEELPEIMQSLDLIRDFVTHRVVQGHERGGHT